MFAPNNAALAAPLTTVAGNQNINPDLVRWLSLHACLDVHTRACTDVPSISTYVSAADVVETARNVKWNGFLHLQSAPNWGVTFEGCQPARNGPLLTCHLWPTENNVPNMLWLQVYSARAG